MTTEGRGPGLGGVTWPAVVTTRGAIPRSRSSEVTHRIVDLIARTPQGRPAWPAKSVLPESDSDAGSLGDLARADASGADPDVLRSSVDHRTHPLEVWQPASLRHIVSVGDVAAAHRPLAADFTSLRHFRTPSRNPRMGVEFNSTGGPDYQVLDQDCASIFQRYLAGNRRRASKRTVNYFTERRTGSKIFTVYEIKNDTLIRRYGPDSELENRGTVDGARF